MVAPWTSFFLTPKGSGNVARGTALVVLHISFLPFGAEYFPRPGEVLHPLQSQPHGLRTRWIRSVGMIHIATPTGRSTALSPLTVAGVGGGAWR